MKDKKKMKKHKIVTSNKELYKKFNLLNFTSEIVLDDEIENKQINKIIQNINKKENNIEYKKIDGFYVIKKIKPIYLNLYMLSDNKN
jgi:hypothetical protein